MSAAYLDLHTVQNRYGIQVDRETLVRQIVRSQPQRCCPECQSIIYSRRHKLCGVCGQPLPAEVLFSAVDAARVKALVHQEKSRHRAWMTKA